jgi:hypothetical protein
VFRVSSSSSEMGFANWNRTSRAFARSIRRRRESSTFAGLRARSRRTSSSWAAPFGRVQRSSI